DIAISNPVFLKKSEPKRFGHADSAPVRASRRHFPTPHPAATHPRHCPHAARRRPVTAGHHCRHTDSLYWDPVAASAYEADVPDNDGSARSSVAGRSTSGNSGTGRSLEDPWSPPDILTARRDNRKSARCATARDTGRRGRKISPHRTCYGVSRELEMNAAQVAAAPVMDFHRFHSVLPRGNTTARRVSKTRLTPRTEHSRQTLGITYSLPVHRIASPDHDVAGPLHSGDVIGEVLLDVIDAVAGNQSALSHLPFRVQLVEQRAQILRSHGRPAFDADRVFDAAEVLDMRPVQLPGAVADPKKVGSDIVPSRLPAPGAARQQPRQRRLVLEVEALVGHEQVHGSQGLGFVAGVCADRLHVVQGVDQAVDDGLVLLLRRGRSHVSQVPL
ncbi:MAG: hypothetical protein BJ554DRAFT_7793, partial [Olpidium bornovanus]